MKLKLAAIAALAVIGLLGACSGPSSDSSPSTSAPTSSAAPSTPASKPSGIPFYNPQLTDSEKAALAYYESPERKARFQQLMDTLGKQLLNDFVSRGVKLDTTGWDKKKPAPQNGYGSVITHDTSSRGFIVQLQVMFKDGKPDTTISPIGLFVQKDGTSYMTNTISLDAYANPVMPSHPDDYQWAIMSPARMTDVHLLPIDGSSIDLNKPMAGTYRVYGTKGNAAPELTADGIHAADNEFFNTIAAFNLNSSDWS